MTIYVIAQGYGDMKTDFLDYHFRLKIRDRTLFVILGAIVALIITDIAILRVSVFLVSKLYQGLASVIFVLLSMSLLGLQYLILGYIRSKMKESQSGATSLKAVRAAATLGQYAMLATAIILIIQLISNSYFQTVLLTTAVALSYSVSIIALSLLTSRFLIWHRSDRNPLVLAYGVASAMLVLNAIFTLVFATAILNDRNPVIVPHAGVSVLNVPAGSLKASLEQTYIISSIASFIALWIATTLHLRYYSRRFGSIRYWVVLGVPLAYFLTQFAILFVDVLDPLIETSPTLVSMVLTVAFTASKPAGGVLFGIAFWVIARKTASPDVKSYLTIAAFGLVFFFASNQAVVLVSNTFYPPFGLGSVSYVGLASYLILIGIFFSAASISQDRKILAQMRKSALDELKLLGSIGSSENKEQIVGIATKVAKRNQAELVDKSGVQSSLDEDDMKKYLDEVFNEIEAARKREDDNPQV